MILNSAMHVLYGFKKYLLSDVKIFNCNQGLLCINKKHRSYNKSVFRDTRTFYLPGSRMKFCFQRELITPFKLTTCERNKVDVC